ncbi:equilibrative nucleobase transporter 1-like [Clavelina lepadiformis]|uniref:equilibrative nucleobase transporter 1-like n=1 Tax=Clavelina lepadiformis TaxID=159417 RepID=UPI0040437E28
MRKIEVLSVLSGFVEVFLYSGIIFGWTSFRYILVEEGYFSRGCEIDVLNNSVLSKLSPANRSVMRNVQTKNKSITSTLCPYQEAKLNLVFTLSGSSLYLCNFFFGCIFDVFGSWVVRTLASLLLLAGMLLMAFSNPDHSILLYPSCIFIAIGGHVLMTTNVQLAHLSNSCKFLLFAIFNGLYDASSVVFFLMRLMYQEGVAIATMAQGMCWCTLLIHVRTLFFMPRKKLLADGNERFGRLSKITGCIIKIPARKHEISEEIVRMNLDGCRGSSKNTHSVDVPPFKTSLRSAAFWTTTTHYCTLSFVDLFFIGTLQPWLESIHEGSEIENTFVPVFSTILCSGSIMTVVPGFMTDQIKAFYQKKRLTSRAASLKALYISLACLSTLGAAVSLLKLIPILKLQYITFSLFVVFRSFLYYFNCSFIATAFPYQHFGRLFGIELTITGLVHLLQYPFVYISLNSFHGSFTIINSLLFSLSALSCVHSYYTLFHFKPALSMSNNENTINLRP